MALAKITRPTSVGTLTRPRLFRLLDGGKHKQVSWVWGPPGAGKTTLVASYLTTRNPTLWYQVDEVIPTSRPSFIFLRPSCPDATVGRCRC